MKAKKKQEKDAVEAEGKKVQDEEEGVKGKTTSSATFGRFGHV